MCKYIAVNMHYISRVMGIKKDSNHKSYLQTHSQSLLFMPFDRPYTVTQIWYKINAQFLLKSNSKLYALYQMVILPMKMQWLVIYAALFKLNDFSTQLNHPKFYILCCLLYLCN